MTVLGPIMLDLAGPELTVEEKEILQHPQVGGIILFSRNYENTHQLQQLMQDIRHFSQRHLLVSVDHEGGRVQRFRHGFSALPALGTLGNIYCENKSQGENLIKQAAWLMATELLAFGIDFSFAPVLDLDKGISTVIGNRAFHHNSLIVSECAQIYLSGLKQTGMSSVGKHFPGHGSVQADSHIDIPIDARDYQHIEQEDLIPFQILAKQLNGIMPAHVIYEQVDSLPAGFSTFWLQTVLRQKLGFDGAIFSDDLTMAGAHVVGDILERVKLALDAGCDCLLICNDRASAITALEYLERKHHKINPESSERLLKLRGHGKLTHAELSTNSDWQAAVKLITSIH